MSYPIPPGGGPSYRHQHAVDARIAAMSDEELVAWFAGTKRGDTAPSLRVFRAAVFRIVDLGLIPPVDDSERAADVWQRTRDACQQHLLAS